MVKIIADTTSCLPPSIQEDFRIPLVPQMIHFGEQSFTEGRDISNQTFLEKLQQAKDLPKTSAPPPELFQELFESHQDQPILCIHPSADLSGTVRSAETARLDYPDLDIDILDTRLVASPLGVAVHQAAIWSREGLSKNVIIKRLNEFCPRGRIYFLVATLEYLARGGRIGGASALVGNALKIKPLLRLSDGRVEPHSKERTFRKAFKCLKALALDEYPASGDGYLSIMHADSRPLAEELGASLAAELNLPQPIISDLPPAIITHAGPGAIAVGFFA